MTNSKGFLFCVEEVEMSREECDKADLLQLSFEEELYEYDLKTREVTDEDFLTFKETFNKNI